MKIKKLDDNLINLIAAGEVVERPASCVKELLENSIDAGSSEISVEIISGGLELIRVRDNGCGMVPEDMKLAGARHATSKISSKDDLEKISTMGFRGEALSSISAASLMKIMSKTRDKDAGFFCDYKDGEVVSSGPFAMDIGTAVEITGLFKNIPARLKFIKSESAETRHIYDVFEKVSLSSNASMKLVSNGREIYNFRKDAPTSEKLNIIWALNTKETFIEINNNAGDEISIKGFVSVPGLDARVKTRQYFFVNNRPVQSKILSHALMQAYRTYIMRDRYPMCALFFEMPYDTVDINIHPRKLEVKFMNDGRAHDFTASSIEGKLKEGRPAAFPEKPGEAEQSGSSKSAVKESLKEFYNKERGKTVEIFKTTEKKNKKKSAPPEIVLSRPLPHLDDDFRLIGQLGNSYILFEDEAGLAVVDQHAAEERILYQKYLGEFLVKKIEVQYLLLPFVITFSPAVSLRLTELTDMLAGFGFVIEVFGENTFRLKGFPALFSGKNETGIAKDLIETITQDELYGIKQTLPEEFRDRIIIQACRAASKANMRMTDEEMNRLIRDLKACESKDTCPHGRVTRISFSFSDLEKKFGRKE